MVSVSKVITQLEMQKYAGQRRVCFPEDVIITPAARDWAKAHQIEIVCQDQETEAPADCTTATATNRDDFLKQVILAVRTSLGKEGLPLTKEAVVEAVIRCLQRLGCEIK